MGRSTPAFRALSSCSCRWSRTCRKSCSGWKATWTLSDVKPTGRRRCRERCKYREPRSCAGNRERNWISSSSRSGSRCCFWSQYCTTAAPSTRTTRPRLFRKLKVLRVFNVFYFILKLSKNSHNETCCRCGASVKLVFILMFRLYWFWNK